MAMRLSLPFFLWLPSPFIHIGSSLSPTSPGGGTKRVWRFRRIKNLRAIKSQAMPGIHQPGCVCACVCVGGGYGKSQAIYFYICFLFKSGRLWQNDVSPFLGSHETPSVTQSTWEGVKCVVCLRGDVPDLFKSMNKIITKKKNPPALHYRQTSDLITLLFITAKLWFISLCWCNFNSSSSIMAAKVTHTHTHTWTMIHCDTPNTQKSTQQPHTSAESLFHFPRLLVTGLGSFASLIVL